MTSTSGPGFSLMMENIGLGLCADTLRRVQCAEGRTQHGLPTLVAQGDMMQARWGSHGHYEIIALSPSSPQEMFDLTIRAFNLSEEFRLPVIILADEVIGHMNERVVIPPEEEIRIASRRKTGRLLPMSFCLTGRTPDGVSPMANCGDGYRIHVTGLTHDDRGYPAMNPEAQEHMIGRLVGKIRENRKQIIRTENIFMDDAEVAVVAYGISASSARHAVREARQTEDPGGAHQTGNNLAFPRRI